MAFTAEDIKSLTPIIQDAVKSATDKIDASMEGKLALDKAQLKAMFPELENGSIGGYAKTIGGSEIDFSCFGRIKSMTPRMGSEQEMQNAMGMSCALNGGPFVKLSPVMENFAKLLLTGAGKSLSRVSSMGGQGFLDTYSGMVKDQNVKARGAFGIKGQDEGTGADGGYTVPIEFSNVVVEFATQMSPIIAKVWRIPMTTNQSKWPKLVQSPGSYYGGVAVTYATEAQTASATKVSFDQNVFNAHKVFFTTALTDELIQDSLINIVNYVAGVFTRAFWYEIEHNIIDGNGQHQALGIIQDPIVKANALTRHTAGKVTPFDLYTLEGAMDENFSNLYYITRRKALTSMRTQVDTVGQPLVHEPWQTFAGGPTMTPLLNGYPYHVTRNCHDIGHLGDIICGDLGFYQLAIRQDMRIDVSDAPYWTSDQLAMRLIARFDGKPGSSYAFNVLQGTGS